MSSAKPQKKKGWRYKVDLGPLSIVLWGVFILFFMAWIFILGIFVGRGVLPGRITNIFETKGENTKLTRSIDTEGDKESYSVSSDIIAEKEPELEFYDKLTAKKDDARNNFHPEETKINNTISQPLGAAEGKPSGTDVKEVKSSGDSTDRSGSGQYTIQVASITELAKAEKTVKQLVEKGFNAYYYEATVKGKKYYRVRCGKFSDRVEAQKYSLRLEQKTGLKGYVTGVE
jgi:cell division septation protein DedD